MFYLLNLFIFLNLIINIKLYLNKKNKCFSYLVKKVYIFLGARWESLAGHIWPAGLEFDTWFKRYIDVVCCILHPLFVYLFIYFPAKWKLWVSWLAWVKIKTRNQKILKVKWLTCQVTGVWGHFLYIDPYGFCEQVLSRVKMSTFWI